MEFCSWNLEQGRKLGSLSSSCLEFVDSMSPERRREGIIISPLTPIRESPGEEHRLIIFHCAKEIFEESVLFEVFVGWLNTWKADAAISPDSKRTEKFAFVFINYSTYFIRWKDVIGVEDSLRSNCAIAFMEKWNLGHFVKWGWIKGFVKRQFYFLCLFLFVIYSILLKKEKYYKMNLNKKLS